MDIFTKGRPALAASVVLRKTSASINRGCMASGSNARQRTQTLSSMISLASAPSAGGDGRRLPSGFEAQCHCFEEVRCRTLHH